MKTNREFLNGVYAKAENLQSEININKRNNKKYYRFASVMALVILIPTFFMLNNNLNYKEIQQGVMVRAMSNDPLEYFNESDFIVIGETKDIGESRYIKHENYIYTDMKIGIDQVLLGEIDDPEIVVRVNGGRVKSDKVYSKMESEFVQGKRSLLFLIQYEDGLYQLVGGESQFLEVEKDIFVDKLGNKYSLEDIKKNIMTGDN